MKVVSIYDPTARDAQSRVRGVGRYLTTLKEMAIRVSKTETPAQSQTGVAPYKASSANPGDNLFFQPTADLKTVKKDHIFLNPFFNPIQKPLKLAKLAKYEIALIHDLIPLKYHKHFPIGFKGMIFKFLNNFSLKKYDLIVTDSQASKKDIISIYKIPEKKIKVIYPTVAEIFLPHLDTATESSGHHHPFHKIQDHSVAEFTEIPLENISKNPALANLKDFNIYVGDATWNKNLPQLARAIKMTGIPCVFVGQVFGEKVTNKAVSHTHAWQKSLREFFQLAENDKNFIFPGFVSDIELVFLYRKARVNVLVSQDEGFGYSFIEAGFMSTPSVLSDIPVFHEIAGESAEFANPADPKDIAQKISQIFYDQNEHEKMSIKAFERAQEFDPARFQKSWLEIFNIL